MGMYDTIVFHCPNCGEKIFAQSKSGGCYLDDFNIDAVPPDVAMDANRHAPFECDCGKKWVITDIPWDIPTVSLGLEEYKEEEDVSEKKK